MTTSSIVSCRRCPARKHTQTGWWLTEGWTHSGYIVPNAEPAETMGAAAKSDCKWHKCSPGFQQSIHRTRISTTFSVYSATLGSFQPFCQHGGPYTERATPCPTFVAKNLSPCEKPRIDAPGCRRAVEEQRGGDTFPALPECLLVPPLDKSIAPSRFPLTSRGIPTRV